MADDLRTRIAAALDRHKTDPYDEWTCQCGSSGTRWAEHVADAVIRELKMRQEWRAAGNSCVEPQDCPEDARLYGDVIETRYVTSWEPACAATMVPPSEFRYLTRPDWRPADE